MPRRNPTADLAPKGTWTTVHADDLRDYPEIYDEVAALIDTAYAPIGGHLKLRSADDIVAEIDHFDLLDHDDDPQADAVLLGKHKGGIKHVATGHDNERASKRELVRHKIELLREPGHYVEASGRLAEILLDAGLPVVTDEATVRAVLGKPIAWVGDGWYERTIGGHPETKIMIGSPYVTNPDSRSMAVAARLARGG